MADETVDLNFLARQGCQILDELSQARAAIDISLSDSRDVLGELARNRAGTVGLDNALRAMRDDIAIVRSDVATMRTTTDEILFELRAMRIDIAVIHDQLRRLETKG